MQGKNMAKHSKTLDGVSREISSVNKKINKIFKKHKVKPGIGEEGFYNAIDKVREKNKSDAKKLMKLGDHWAIQMAFNYKKSM